MNPEVQAKQLMRSERGENTLKGLILFLEQNCWSLDRQNQRAVIELVGSFFENPHATLDILKEEIP